MLNLLNNNTPSSYPISFLSLNCRYPPNPYSLSPGYMTTPSAI